MPKSGAIIASSEPIKKPGLVVLGDDGVELLTGACLDNEAFRVGSWAVKFLHGMQGVSGSNPLGSIERSKTRPECSDFWCGESNYPSFAPNA